MTELRVLPVSGRVVEEELQLTLAELCRACAASEQTLRVWVLEGVLSPADAGSADWRFGGDALARALRATRLQRDLDLDAAGVALALDLLDRIAALEAQLKRISSAGGREPTSMTTRSSA